ncbi:hypothetical protein [Pengzhenrongella sicca]|uniref:Uncharacterized protein n=1 Tax=Pengzhenrongella sicca TaxID=2819238 RepID=A0A8A4ZGD6_9MICO|nr:hypothetical protein [Pengzhenrongella sicca]QTE31092.1 hypothetical protein J4E96_09305 [Pengzhenrongella sicca]
MDQLLTILVAVTAVIASVFGVLIGLDQLTQRARMRRIAEWSRELADDEADAGRLDALAQVHAWAASQMVASVMVPARFYLEAAVWAVAAPFVIVASYGDLSTWVLGLLAVGAIWSPMRRAIRAYLERYRIASEYFRGGKMTSPNLSMLHLMEGGTRAEFLWAVLIALGLVGLSVSAGALVAKDENSWPLYVALGSVGAAWLAVDAVRARTPRLLYVSRATPTTSPENP